MALSTCFAFPLGHFPERPRGLQIESVHVRPLTSCTGQTAPSRMNSRARPHPPLQLTGPASIRYYFNFIRSRVSIAIGYLFVNILYQRFFIFCTCCTCCILYMKQFGTPQSRFFFLRLKLSFWAKPRFWQFFCGSPLWWWKFKTPSIFFAVTIFGRDMKIRNLKFSVKSMGVDCVWRNFWIFLYLSCWIHCSMTFN